MRNRKPRRKLTTWQRIARAGERRTGLRLSYADVRTLCHDGAIMTRAEKDWDHDPDDPDCDCEDCAGG